MAQHVSYETLNQWPELIVLLDSFQILTFIWFGEQGGHVVKSPAFGLEGQKFDPLQQPTEQLL